MANKRLPLTLAFTILPWALSGCVFGAIYTDTREPVVTNMKNTPRGGAHSESETVQLSIPTTSASIAAAWDSQAIGDAARQGGLSEIYYADAHTVSVLLGLWEKKTIEVYGSR